MESEIIQQLLDHITAGGAHYFNSIGEGCGYYKSPIKEAKKEGSIVTICFVNGMLDIYDTDKIIRIRRVENRLNNCEYCYKVKSKDGNIKCYILKDLEVS